MRITSGSCEKRLPSRGTLLIDDRNKHKDHWKPFDRKHTPKWMRMGQIGLDDKRKPCSWPGTEDSGRIHPARAVCLVLPVMNTSDHSSFVVEVKASEIVPAGKHHREAS